MKASEGSAQFLRLLFVQPIRFYKYFISPLLPPACRFTPTCSEYAMQAILQHGIFKGGALAIKRICRCHPWGGYGWDPVPPAKKTPIRSPHNHVGK